ncbi:MAG: cysteine--tRNA ligase, partial [Acidobacteria bacterium]|nr:cysteine--tRNA ligase [Acidobacteriota bacterium]
PHHKQLNFTLEGLRGAESTVARLNDFRQRLTEVQPEQGATPAIARMAELSLKRFEDAMDDDLNTAEALAPVHDFVRETNSSLATGAIKSEDKAVLLATVEKFDSVFGIFGEVKKEMLDSDIQALIDERQAARKAKNFARSDEIRDQLTELGIILEDTKDGVRWKRK